MAVFKRSLHALKPTYQPMYAILNYDTGALSSAKKKRRNSYSFECVFFCIIFHRNYCVIVMIRKDFHLVIRLFKSTTKYYNIRHILWDTHISKL